LHGVIPKQEVNKNVLIKAKSISLLESNTHLIMRKRDLTGASGSFMSERQTGPYDSVARKWLALAERRYAHFIELSDSGRWRHYFTRAEFSLELRRAELLRDQWARIAGVLPEFDEAAEELSVDRGAAA
jgi:hypothetical protein